MGETVWLLGEGGSIIEHSLPLHPDVAKRVAAGLIKRVTADGERWVDETGTQVADVEDASLKDLRKQAKELDLPTSGTKAELVERINAKLGE